MWRWTHWKVNGGIWGVGGGGIGDLLGEFGEGRWRHWLANAIIPPKAPIIIRRFVLDNMKPATV